MRKRLLPQVLVRPPPPLVLGVELIERAVEFGVVEVNPFACTDTKTNQPESHRKLQINSPEEPNRKVHYGKSKLIPPGEPSNREVQIKSPNSFPPSQSEPQVDIAAAIRISISGINI